MTEGPDEAILREIFRRLHDRFGPQHWWPGDTAFEVAVGAILTQNTNWRNVERAISNLKAARALSPRRIRDMDEEELGLLIRPSGYFRQKSRRLKAFVDFLFEQFGGRAAAMRRKSAPRLREALLGLNGIGPETADSILLYAAGKPVFVIDAYTIRVLGRHGLLDGGADYHAVQALFHRHLAPDAALYNEFHALFVRLGKDFCRPRKPACADCPLNDLNGPPAPDG